MGCQQDPAGTRSGSPGFAGIGGGWPIEPLRLMELQLRQDLGLCAFFVQGLFFVFSDLPGFSLESGFCSVWKMVLSV